MHRSCGSDTMCCWVGERSVSRRRWPVRAAGGIRSANADISNDKAGEKPARRKSYPKPTQVVR
ncbi:Hypothetical protein ABZS17I87_03266 [Kosakonia cowanii]